MKYKNLDSFAHNFNHSFLSLTNYVDDGYIIDDLHESARQKYDGPLTIYWIPASDETTVALPSRVQRSIAHFRNWMPVHAQRHGVSLDAIRSFRLEMFRLPSHQLRFDSVLVDDRGQEHRKRIQF